VSDGKTTLGDAFPILGKLAKQLEKAEGPAKAAPKAQPGKNTKKPHVPRPMPHTKAIPTGDFSDLEAQMVADHEEAEAKAKLEKADTLVDVPAIEEPKPMRASYVTPEEDDDAKAR
jgi:hypothetical protein